MAGESRSFKFRFAFALSLVGLATLALAARYGFLMLSPRDPVPQRLSAVERGPILDREGRLLAVAATRFDIGVWKPDVPAGLLPQDAEELSGLLGLNKEEIAQRVREAPSDFLFLKKDASLSAADRIKALRSQQVALSSTDEDGKPVTRMVRRMSGVVVQESPGRIYPMGESAAHAIGFVDASNAGASGIEYAFQDELSPAPVAGKPRSYGNQVVLSLDAGVQAVLERIAKQAMEENGAEAIMFLAADPRNGDILGYAAYPTFDPNDVSGATDADLLNYPISYPYEPGSVFKVFSLSSILQLGGINPRSTFFCDGAYRATAPSGEPILIKCLGHHGTVDLASILSLSCNAGAAYASDTVNAQDFYGMLSSYGFGDRSGVGFKGEETGILQPVERWSLRSKPTIAMGQEILVTAMQMVQAAIAVANGGTLLKPRLVTRVLSPDGKTVWENPVVPLRHVLSPENAASVIGAMEGGASAGGTGWRAGLKDIRLAVKTGTAQMVEHGKSTYSDRDYIASTLAILPADSPRLVLYLVIVKPHGSSYYGGQIAAPVVGRAADELAQLLDIPRAGQKLVGHPGSLTLPEAPLAAIGDVMPDLRGLSKRSLVPLLGRTDISVAIRGTGYVVRQSPDPGSPVPPGTAVVLELE